MKALKCPLAVLLMTVAMWLMMAAGASLAGTSADLQALIDAAAPGDTVLVPAGTYSGPVTIDKPLRLIGENRPLIDNGGKGTVVRITAPGVELRGFRIRGSGHSLAMEDSGVMATAAQTTVADNVIDAVLFGIVIKNGNGSLVENNHVTGHDMALSLMGDGIRAWHSHNTRILNNTVLRTREILVESSTDVTVSGNVVLDGRVGLHLMRGTRLVITDNIIKGNTVGIYAMYVLGLEATGNQVLHNRGPSGYGIALKEGTNQTVANNWTVGNNIGIYFDNSPDRPDAPNFIHDNAVVANDIGALFTPATNGNTIWGNDFLENLEQVATTGGGRLGRNLWSKDGVGNHWDDYAGYDVDRDGIGEFPYRSVRLFENLMDRQPVFRWFRFSPAAVAVDLSARAFPAVAPEPKLEDPAPLMQAGLPALPKATLQEVGLTDTAAGHMIWIGLVLVAVAAGVMLGTGLRPRRWRSG